MIRGLCQEMCLTVVSQFSGSAEKGQFLAFQYLIRLEDKQSSETFSEETNLTKVGQDRMG